MIISPVLEYVIGRDALGSWQNHHIGPPTYAVRVIKVGEAKWKPLVLPLHRKIVNQKQYCNPEVSASIKNMRDAGMVIPTTSPLTLLLGLCRKQMDLEE